MKSKSIISMYNAIFTEGNLFVPNNAFNGLLKINICENKVEYLTALGEDKSVAIQYKYIFKCSDRLIMIPVFSPNICIYDLSDNKVQLIPIGEGYTERISAALCIDDKILMFPLMDGQELLCFDTRSLQLETVSTFRRELQKFPKGNKVVMSRVSLSDLKMIFARYRTSYIGVWDYRTSAMDIIDTGFDDIFAAVENKETVWLIPNKGACIGKYDLNTCKLETIDINRYDDLNIGDVRPCNDIVCVGENVFLLPFRDPYVYVFKDNCFSPIDIGNDYVMRNKRKICSFGSIKVNDELWILPFGDSNMILCIKKDLSVECIDLSGFDFPFFERIVQINRNRSFLINENENEDLRQYINFLAVTITL